MTRLCYLKFGLAILVLGAGLGASPATPSYVGIEQVIERVRSAWSEPDAREQPNAPGWNTYFDALQAELQNYAVTTENTERRRSLNRLYRMWEALEGVTWKPGIELRNALESWLRPRIALSWAEKRLGDALETLATTDEANQQRWLEFRDAIQDALDSYEAAGTVFDRHDAQRKLSGGLASLRDRLQQRRWSPALELENALDNLIDRPNVDAKVGVSVVQPVLDQAVVEPEVIFFRGQTSYVTPGPKTGFGLLPSDQGILFYNSQIAYATTPIQGFHEQVAQDPQGRRAANMYYFNATGYNTNQVSVQGLLTGSGLFLYPATNSNVTAAIGSAPIAGFGPHLSRSIASLVGFGQGRVTSEVQRGALPQIQQETAEGSQELAQIKTAQRQAEVNAQLREFLVGDNTLAVQDFLLTKLKFRSQPQYAQIGGLIRWNDVEGQIGADFPEPPRFETFETGVTADIHLSSVLTNLAAGFLQSPMAQGVENLMLEIQPNGPDSPPGEEVTVSENVDFDTFLEKVQEIRALNDPRALVVRVRKPSVPPAFAADANGNLVVLLKDITLEVSAPPAAAEGRVGQRANVFRIVMPQAELAVSFEVEFEAEGGPPTRVEGEVVEFDSGPNAQVFALIDDEDDPTPLNLIGRAAVLGTLTSQIRSQSIDVPIPTDQLQGIELREVTPLDPTGWIRVVVEPTEPIKLDIENGLAGAGQLTD